MFRNARAWAALVALVLITSGMGCKSWGSGGGAKTLYERLGGEPAISAVVNDFVNRAANDPRVNFTREGQPNHWNATPENVAKVKEHLTQFIVEATGGPKEYHGADMATVHKGMNITDNEFNAAAEDLKASLDKFHVPDKEQTELMNIVGSTRDQIVGK